MNTSQLLLLVKLSIDATDTQLALAKNIENIILKAKAMNALIPDILVERVSHITENSERCMTQLQELRAIIETFDLPK